MRTTTWQNNQDLSKKLYAELCDMKGLHPFGGEQRCRYCKTRRRFVDKKQGDYSFAIMCTYCRKVISPMTETLFAHTKIHLSVWMKAMYILKFRQPDIMVKDLSAALNVSLPTARTIRRKVMKLRKNAFEIRLLQRVDELISQNYTFIFNEHPMREG